MSKTPEELIEIVCKQMDTGFTRLESSIDQTNQRLDQTNQRLDQNNQRLEQLASEFSGFRDEFNEKFSDLRHDFNEKFSGFRGEFNEFRKEVRQDLKGITSFLSASEANVYRLETRIISCETRLDRLERPEQSA